MDSTILERIRVLIVEDNDFIRLGIRTALDSPGSDGSISVVGEAMDGLEAIQKCAELAPDVVLMDLEMPIMNGIASTRAIRQLNGTSRVIMLTSHEEDEKVYRALSAGASGYCLKDVGLARLKEAIQAVYSGDVWLDSSIAGKVIKLCAKEDSPRESAEEQSFTTPYGALSAIEREIMNLLVNGCTTSEIANRLKLPGSTAKAYVVNVLNKVTNFSELHSNMDEFSTEATAQFNRDSTLMEKYELIGRLGAGGMSVVFKARHRLLSRMVAIKLLNGEAFGHPGVQQRFIQEAQITSQLSHPSIINVHDFGINIDGQPYLVMDYVDGPSLAQLLERGGPLKEQEALRIFRQVSSALAFAHSKGIVHRDVKPSNVMLSCEPGQDFFVKILDFGLAQVSCEQEDNLQKLTSFGALLGSPLYMSPEQCAGKPVDARSDMYSFGCLMYEALRGRPPFIGDNALETMNLHINEDVPPLDDRPYSENLRHLISRCLAKSPEHRFASTQELSRQLSVLVS